MDNGEQDKREDEQEVKLNKEDYRQHKNQLYAELYGGSPRADNDTT